MPDQASILLCRLFKYEYRKMQYEKKYGEITEKASIERWGILS
jgi:hypothetical protein